MTKAIAIIEQVALYLGPPWKFNRLGEPSSWRYDIIDGTGRGLWFRHDSHKDRFEISGQFPRTKTNPHSNDYKTISVSAARPPKDIAGDISRRLIPHYLEAYERAAARFQEEQERKAQLSLIAQAIIKVTGGRLAGHGRSGRTVYFDHGEAEIWSTGAITLQLRSLSADRAIQLAALFTQQKNQEGVERE